MASRKIRYRYPLPKNVKIKILHPTGDFAHANFPWSRYAVDFLVDIGTSVFAARGGVVVKVRDSSEKWGLDESFANEVNFVRVDHGDGTFAEYLHLGKNKVMVEKDQNVKAGELLGYTGLSGCMDLPHLHFHVFKIEDGKGISLPIEWE